MIHAEYVKTGLEDRYNEILRTRMQDVPVVNPALAVSAVGFREWEGSCLGVLVTPWFMNLMLVNCEGDGWSDLQVGSKQRHAFPSGVYEFTVGYEEDMGRYQSCALFSPMFEFESQQQAVSVAEEILQMLMDEAHVDASGSSRRDEILDQWARPDNDDAAAAASDEAAVAPAQISRRDLLRGRLRGDQTATPGSTDTP